jgi:uncharacterized protein (TIGR02246 family)
MTARTPEETHALIEAAFNAGDLDAFVAVYEADAATTVPGSDARAQGHTAIRAAVEPMFALAPKARMEVVEKLEAGELALTLARWTLELPGDEGPTSMSGNGTIVSRRQADGTWRIVLDIPDRPGA